MNESFVGSDEGHDPAHQTLSSVATQAVATALAQRGGIGIANLLVRQLSQHPPPAQVTAEAKAGTSDP
jgi:Rod binding domain-containing protein